jgi:Zn-dependent M28 family amino/carboxypeptidase
MDGRSVGRLRVTAAVIAALALLAASSSVGADNGADSTALRTAVSVERITDHLAALQDIADANGGHRAAGSAGHVDSAGYVFGLLDDAGYNVSLQNFSYDTWIEDAPAAFVAPGLIPVVEVDFTSMSYSGNGSVTSVVQAVDLLLPPIGGSTSGCEATDFPSSIAGKIALIQRGTCTFHDKAANAEAAGAAGVIIFNEGNTPDREGLLFGTLGTSVGIPVIGTTFALGQTLAAVAPVTVTLSVTSHVETTETYNVLADTPTGRKDRIVVAGGHLDSVREGPGINDNGSGTMTLLEVALQMAELNIKPRNMVRFAFWSGEEDGLIGSQYYVDQLSTRDVKNHALNLNFDMIASPNFARFIYDGDGSDSEAAGPNGSAVIEDIFESYFQTQGLATEPTTFDGRSDYGPFIDRGIPAGGLFTGAEDLNAAGDAFDPCYHLACDDIDNINVAALGQMSDAVAHAVLTFAQTTSAVNGTAKGGGGSIDLELKGSRYVK